MRNNGLNNYFMYLLYILFCNKYSFYNTIIETLFLAGIDLFDLINSLYFQIGYAISRR